MKRLFLISFILLLLTSCNNTRRVINRDCDCIISNNVYTNPHWNLSLYDSFWSFNKWQRYTYNSFPRYYIPSPLYIPRIPYKYDRRNQTRVQPRRRAIILKTKPDQNRPSRTPLNKSNTRYNKNKLQDNERSSYGNPTDTPNRTVTPRVSRPSQPTPSRNNQNRTVTPSRNNQNRTVTPRVSRPSQPTPSRSGRRNY